MEKMVRDFYKNKIVLITGHTGFKGSWLARILLTSGAKVIGYSLKPPTEPNLFSMAGFSEYEQSGQLVNVTGDIRDLPHLKSVFDQYKPEIVFHLAAQPIVRDSYRNPVYTYETNVMGTVNVLECIRLSEHVSSAVIITTDKVYKNNEWIWGYRENEPLDGYDPYSNSKSCAELAVHAYRNSFFNDMHIPVSTSRAGNVIGGGDFANDRIIPDCVRAISDAIAQKSDNAVVAVRNPYSTRPYQHVLEPLFMYMTIAEAQWYDFSIASYYNVGPDDCDCVTTGDLVTMFCDKWNKSLVPDHIDALPELSWEDHSEPDAPHEASLLKLDSSRIKSVFGYRPRWHIDECIRETVIFAKMYLMNPDQVPEEMDREISEYFI